MGLRFRVSEIKCLEETVDGWTSADEVYLVVAAVDLESRVIPAVDIDTPEIALAGANVPAVSVHTPRLRIPSISTTLYGPYKNFDKGETRTPAKKYFWPLPTATTANKRKDFVPHATLFVIGLFEQDSGKARAMENLLRLVVSAEAFQLANAERTRRHVSNQVALAYLFGFTDLRLLVAAAGRGTDADEMFYAPQDLILDGFDLLDLYAKSIKELGETAGKRAYDKKVRSMFTHNDFVVTNVPGPPGTLLDPIWNLGKDDIVEKSFDFMWTMGYKIGEFTPGNRKGKYRVTIRASHQPGSRLPS